MIINVPVQFTWLLT